MVQGTSIADVRYRFSFRPAKNNHQGPRKSATRQQTLRRHPANTIRPEVGNAQWGKAPSRPGSPRTPGTAVPRPSSTPSSVPRPRKPSLPRIQVPRGDDPLEGIDL